jgi:hypothetical protein
VGDGAGVLAVGVEDNTVGAGRATGVDAAGLDRELLVRAADGEVEALVVVVLVTVVTIRWLAIMFQFDVLRGYVRVVAAADLLAVVVVVHTLVGGGADLAGGVIGVAAVGGGLTLLEDGVNRGGDGEGREEEGGKDGETHLFCVIE